MAKIKREVVHIDGLPYPWKAFRSVNHKGRIFYFNKVTKKSSWEVPAFEWLSKMSSISSSIFVESRKEEKKKTVVYSFKLPSNFNGAMEKRLKTIRSEPSSDNFMDVDDGCEGSVPKCDEPMEVDVVGEVNAYRQDPASVNLVSLDSSLFFLFKNHNDVSSFLKKKIRNQSCALFVVDTCLLLEDVLLLRQAVFAGIGLLVPYIVLKELDGLKMKGTAKVRSAVQKVNSFLLELSTSASEYIFLENYFEHQSYAKEFSCTNNDDMIMKCAVVAKMKCQLISDAIDVYLVTNDKNLALKSKSALLQVLFHEDIFNIVQHLEELNKDANVKDKTLGHFSADHS